MFKYLKKINIIIETGRNNPIALVDVARAANIENKIIFLNFIF